VSTAVGARALPRAQRQRLLAQCVVGALGHRYGRIGIAAGPGLDAGVEVHRAFVPAVADQGDARDVDRNVEHEVAATDQRIERAAEILARQALLDELDAKARRFLVADVVGADDADALGAQAQMPQDQRQHPLADAAESDQDDAPGKIDVHFVLAHYYSAVARIGARVAIGTPRRQRRPMATPPA
jgi:hypothetical protein